MRAGLCAPSGLSRRLAAGRHFAGRPPQEKCAFVATTAKRDKSVFPRKGTNKSGAKANKFAFCRREPPRRSQKNENTWKSRKFRLTLKTNENSLAMKPKILIFLLGLTGFGACGEKEIPVAYGPFHDQRHGYGSCGQSPRRHPHHARRISDPSGPHRMVHPRRGVRSRTVL